MKYCYNSLIIGLVLANSTIFPTPHLDSKLSPSDVNIIARSTCQDGMNNVRSQLYKKGVRQVSFDLVRGEANKSNFGNPTKRSDTLYVTLSSYDVTHNTYDIKVSEKVNNILDAPLLLTQWSELISQHCNNIAIVAFSQYGTDDGASSFAIQSDGKMKKRTCNYDLSDKRKPWHEGFCS